MVIGAGTPGCGAVGAVAGTAVVGGCGAAPCPPVGAVAGITPGPGAAPGPLAAGAALSSTLVPSARAVPPVLPRYVKASVQMKNKLAHAAVERDKKLALPVAPNKLPDAPLPKEAPMSAPLPCWISTRPIITKADSSCTARIKVIQICMIEKNSRDSSFVRRWRQLAARQMAMKSAAFNDAPPIRPPSMSACANSVAALSGLTLPP